MNTGLVAGCAVAGFVVIVIALVAGYKYYKYKKWKEFVNANTEDVSNDNNLYAYPKTDKYTVLSVGERGRRLERVYYDNPTLDIRDDEQVRVQRTHKREVSAKSGVKQIEKSREELKEKQESYLDDN